MSNKTSRKSVSLTKATRSEMLHSFFRDVTRQPAIDLLEIENDLALDIYGMIYNSIGGQLAAVPNSMLFMENKIPMPSVVVLKKKAKKVKGSIESSHSDRYNFTVFCHSMTLDFVNSTRADNDINLSADLPQARGAARYGQDHLVDLVKLGLINKTTLKKIEARFVEGCKDATRLVEPVVKVLDGVLEILSSVRTTKGLLEAWPGCEKYLELPQQTGGALMKVDVKVLDLNLAIMYPPAEKSSLAEQL